MNILLGYEPYNGFEIYAFSETGTDFIGRKFNGFRGWAKRTSDGKCVNGGAVHETISGAEDEMKTIVDILLTAEERKSEGKTMGVVAPATLFGFK